MGDNIRKRINSSFIKQSKSERPTVIFRSINFCSNKTTTQEFEPAYILVLHKFESERYLSGINNSFVGRLVDWQNSLRHKSLPFPSHYFHCKSLLTHLTS